MKKIVAELQKLEALIAEEKGEFDLFGLFLREDAPDKWDLLFAADWVDENKASAIKYMAGQVQRVLSKEELMSISRIVIIDESNPSLAAFHSAVHVEHSLCEIQNSNFFGLQINHAFLITSMRRNSALPA
jgi:hypothetical protein